MLATASTSSGAWLQPVDRLVGPVAHESSVGASEHQVLEWVLRRNCSLTPLQLMIVFVLLGVPTLGIAVAFWVTGATLVMPFASAELLAVGIALLAYARHATDRERLRLAGGRLVVEQVNGGRIARTEFDAAWVRVGAAQGGPSLIELSGQGRRVSVGRFVRPELRDALAAELRRALLQQSRR